ncbi:MAG TPA: thioredoxin [Candidatus Thermoplasmatota archaeon]|nr:thioredoxin [Candidatus Thermoplasmatota archaeon]
MPPVVELDDQSFEPFIGDENVLVDFSAEWCGPCRYQEPILKELAEETGGSARIGKLDIDASPNVAGRFGVMGVPTLIVFRKGREIRRFVGVTAKDRLKDALEAR